MQVTKCNVKLVLRLPSGATIRAEISWGTSLRYSIEYFPGSAVRIGIPPRCCT